MTAFPEQIICNILLNFTWTFHLLVNREKAIFISHFYNCLKVCFLNAVSRYSYSLEIPYWIYICDGCMNSALDLCMLSGCTWDSWSYVNKCENSSVYLDQISRKKHFFEKCHCFVGFVQKLFSANQHALIGNHEWTVTETAW